MSIDIIKENCVGCSACVMVCPTEAIIWSSDQNGFKIPQINYEKCIQCNKCNKVCPVITCNEKTGILKGYYGWNNDDNICRQSSSGGIFSALAREVLENNGVVFGAVYSKDYKSVYIGNSEEHSLEELRRSKYVAADPQKSFKQVQEYLKDGKKVLFVSTPCMVAGLKQIIGNHENLYTCDFICGGVSSPQMYKEHMEMLEEKYKSEIIDVNFRPKIKGWQKQWMKINFKNGKEYSKNAFYDLYFNCFMLKHLSIKMSCSICKFRNKHQSDFTIADFWGYKNAGIKYRDKGISLLVLNREHGEQIIRNIRKDVTLFEVENKNIQYAYTERQQSREEKEIQKKFLSDCAEKGFEETASKIALMNPVQYFILRVLSKLKIK